MTTPHVVPSFLELERRVIYNDRRSDDGATKGKVASKQGKVNLAADDA